MPSQSKPNVNTVWASAGLATPVDPTKQALGYVAEIPDYDDFNGNLQQISAFLKHVNQEGIPVWDAATAYFATGYAKGNGTIYVALQDNTNQALPAAGAANAYWADLLRGARNYAVGAGSANVHTATFVPALTVADGVVAKFKAIAANTGAATFNGDPILGGAGAALQGGEIALGGIVTLIRLGANWIIESSSGGAKQGPNATQSQQFVTLSQAQTLFAPPTGKVEWFATMAPPTGYMVALGNAVSRAAYAALFAAITAQLVGTTASGSPTVTAVASPAAMWVGMPISGPGIPAGATVTAVGANTLTLSANATATGVGVALVIAPFGVGDGTTTFNVPDVRGKNIRGWDNGAGLDPSRVFGSYQADANASHNHGVNDPGHAHQHNFVSGTAFTAGGVYGPMNGSSSTAGNFTGITIQNAGGTESRGKNIALLPCVRY
jgi:microcystin-dependent protein